MSTCHSHPKRTTQAHPATGAGPRAPRPRPTDEAEQAFLALGQGAHAWLVEAGASGAQRARSKMTAAIELACLVDTVPIDEAYSAQPGTSAWEGFGR
jgi:hypothetical protein